MSRFLVLVGWDDKISASGWYMAVVDFHPAFAPSLHPCFVATVADAAQCHICSAPHHNQRHEYKQPPSIYLPTITIIVCDIQAGWVVRRVNLISNMFSRGGGLSRIDAKV